MFPLLVAGYGAVMPAPVTLESLAVDLSLIRDELRAISETLLRLDETQARLEDRLVCTRSEIDDAREAMGSIRRELVAHHRLQNHLGGRLQALETARPGEPFAVGVVVEPKPR
jgi:chromosome segregation ATPase